MDEFLFGGGTVARRPRGRKTEEMGGFWPRIRRQCASHPDRRLTEPDDFWGLDRGALREQDPMGCP